MKRLKGLQFTLWHAHKLPFCAHMDSICVFLESQAKHLKIGEQTSNMSSKIPLPISKGVKDQNSSEIMI